MNNTIITLDDHSYSIEDGMVRAFLIVGSERALLLDSGMETEDMLDVAKGITSLPIILANTHADRDHVGSNNQFEKVLMHPDETENYKGTGKKAVPSPVNEGDVISLGGLDLEVFHIPGHTPGSIALLDPESRAVYPGDSVQDGRIFMFGPGRDISRYISSMEKLFALRDRFDKVRACHGTPEVSPELIPCLIQGAKDILEGKITGEDTDVFGKKIKLIPVEGASFLYAP